MNKRVSFSTKLKLHIAGLFFLTSSLTTAAEVAIDTTDANGWNLETYTPGLVVIWNTGAVCENGSGYVSIANPTPGDLSRLWSIVMTAKVSGARIFIRYDNKTCNITSFGMR